MQKILTILAGVAIASLASCGHHDHDTDELGHHHHEHEEAGHMGGEIELEPETAELFGLKTATVEAGSFQDALQVSGQIASNPASSGIISAPTSGIVSLGQGIAEGKDVKAGQAVASIYSRGVSGGDANESARLVMEAAKKELDRVAPLHADGIVSTKDYNAALAAYEQAKSAYSGGAASGRAVASKAGVITQLLVQDGQYVETGAPIAAVSGDKRLSLRADVPERYYSICNQFTTACIEQPGTGQINLADLNGKRNGMAVSSANGYFPIYFTFDNNGHVAPGSYVKVRLLGPKRQDVLSVPVGAISEQQGLKFVYEKLDEECYRKLPVTVGNNNGSRVEILSGLKGGEEIVVDGVAAIRLAETSAVAPEGHSHNH